FIASVLFLIPGFPLVAALFDLLQLQTVAAVSRFAYGLMMLLAVGLGLSFVIAVAGIELSRQPPIELAYPLKLLFNSSPRTVLAVGLLALGANGLRLVLNDVGVMLAPAAFFAALAIGLVAVIVEQRFNVPRMAMAVAPIVIMMPGIYAYEMIVLFNRGPMLDALQASAICGFVIGALAMGLATARFFVRS
ncbi:MAG: threonine/serine exporter family protein, partial [Pseudolabrys sp.]